MLKLIIIVFIFLLGMYFCASFTHKDFIEAVKNISGENWKVGSISRQNFYQEAKKAYCIVTTTDARPFGCFILTKGVILPDGSVWL